MSFEQRIARASTTDQLNGIINDLQTEQIKINRSILEMGDEPVDLEKNIPGITAFHNRALLHLRWKLQEINEWINAAASKLSVI